MLFPIKSIFGRIFLTLIPFMLLISVLYTWLVSTAFYMSEDYVLQDYLQIEYQSFLKDVEKNGDQARLPSNSYLASYWQDDPKLPKVYRRYSPGKYEVIFDESDQNFQLLVAEVPEQHKAIYLILDEQRMSTLSRYESLLDSVLYAVAGLVMIASAVIAVVIARLLAKPITDLAEDVAADWKPDKVFSGVNRADEIGTLSRVFTRMVKELQSLIDKEKSFSRHASHEIRTPLAIIRNSLSVLMLPACSEEKRQRNLKRIKNACESAEKTLDVFLSLGQKQPVLQKQECDLEFVVASTLDNYKTMLDSGCIEVSVQCSEGSIVNAPTSLLEAVVNNLIRNALSYGEGYLAITLSSNEARFRNKVSHSPNTDSRYGYGLEIVRRISESLDWEFNTTVQQNEFIASLKFKTTETT
ncbi:sensor histidine kinase [Spongorhabdus nitratireducens]